MTDVNAELLERLIAMGLEPREAQWLIEEYVPANDPDFVASLMVAAHRRLAGEPLQYVIGHWPFRSLEFDIDPRVLIPRPETEEIVDLAIEELSRSDLATPLLVDLGTGSGVIIVSILNELAQRGVSASGVAVDISADALAVARRNALKHRVLSLSFVQSRWFEELDQSLRGRVAMVISNPPYIAASEMAELDVALDYEPRGALISPDHVSGPGLADVAAIVTEAREWLDPRGVLIVEHGYAQGPATRQLAHEAGYRAVRTVSDLAGHERFLVAQEF